MEKTNKCNVQYVCWGNKATCSFFESSDLPKYDGSSGKIIEMCKHFDDGLCTCKEAQKEAVE